MTRTSSGVRSQKAITSAREILDPSRPVDSEKSPRLLISFSCSCSHAARFTVARLGSLKGPPSAARRGNLAVAHAAPTPAGIQDPSDETPGRTQDMARPYSEICTRPLHGRVLYRVSVSHANDFPRCDTTCGKRAHHPRGCPAPLASADRTVSEAAGAPDGRNDPETIHKCDQVAHHPAQGQQRNAHQGRSARHRHHNG
jgi:hypothetical protein